MRSATGTGNYNTFQQRFGNRVIDTTLNDYDFYIQDQFRVTPKLTLNFGVRYEYTSIPQPTQVNPDYPATGQIHAWQNWAPRFSLRTRSLRRQSFAAASGCSTRASRAV